MKYQIISVQSIYFFSAKGAIYLGPTATEVFSHVKITCYFHVQRYQLFCTKASVVFIGAFINNNYK